MTNWQPKTEIIIILYFPSSLLLNFYVNVLILNPFNTFCYKCMYYVCIINFLLNVNIYCLIVCYISYNIIIIIIVMLIYISSVYYYLILLEYYYFMWNLLCNLYDSVWLINFRNRYCFKARKLSILSESLHWYQINFYWQISQYEILQLFLNSTNI